MIKRSVQYERAFGCKPLLYRIYHRYDDIPEEYLRSESVLVGCMLYYVFIVNACGIAENLVSGQFAGWLFFILIMVFAVICLLESAAKKRSAARRLVQIINNLMGVKK